MKICIRCGIETNDFYDNQKGDICKRCRIDYRKSRLIELKLKGVEYLGGKCVKCGYNKYYGALHFHHRDPSTKDKDFNKIRFKSWPYLKNELNKCDLLCANCHAEEHMINQERLVRLTNEKNKNIDLRSKNKIRKLQKCKHCEKKIFVDGKTKTFACIDCNKNFYSNLRISREKRPSKELIEEFGYSEIGRRYGVSANTIKKWYKQMETL